MMHVQRSRRSIGYCYRRNDLLKLPSLVGDLVQEELALSLRCLVACQKASISIGTGLGSLLR